jgi:23S rRNA (cytidine2498-2'-O)-methyltransferase
MRKMSHAGSANRPTVGRWLWACRAGFEAILCEEFERAGLSAREIEPGLVESAGRPDEPPTFARLGFPVEWVGPTGPEVAARLAQHWKGPVWVQAWVPDSEEGNRRSRAALKLGGEVLAQRRSAQLPVHESSKAAAAARIPLGQLVLLSDAVVAGTQSADEGDWEVSGGRTRARRWKESPSRAAMKLDEALRWKGSAPGRGEKCVDLGAAPGGWSERLLALGARVVAVDPAKLRADLMANRSLEHVVASAFDYAPARPVDWLFCDMAWRPLEVAQLLAKWARNAWARELVSNIKLPMRDKLPMVERVRETLVAGGWKRLRARQLYHDRDEITVVATAR